MMSLRHYGIGLVLAFALAGCAPQEQALPTLMPSPTALVAPTTAPTQPPTPTPLSRPTLPPTWTPSPEPTTEQAEVVQPSPTPLPTQQTSVEQPPAIAATAVPTLEACSSFGVDRERSALLFPLGSAPQVFWKPAVGAARYRIRLIDAADQELLVDYTVEPAYVFRPELFQKDQRYGWSVYPEDQLNQQMCLERGQELIPQ